VRLFSGSHFSRRNVGFTFGMKMPANAAIVAAGALARWRVWSVWRESPVVGEMVVGSQQPQLQDGFGARLLNVFRDATHTFHRRRLWLHHSVAKPQEFPCQNGSAPKRVWFLRTNTGIPVYRYWWIVDTKDLVAPVVTTTLCNNTELGLSSPRSLRIDRTTPAPLAIDAQVALSHAYPVVFRAEDWTGEELDRSWEIAACVDELANIVGTGKVMSSLRVPCGPGHHGAIGRRFCDPPVGVRAPAHREHRFQRIVNTPGRPSGG